LTVVSRRLAKGGFRVITAQNAAEALQRLIWQYFDVVITSDRLEGISGSQLAAHLKSLPTIPRGSAVPIVMLSADSDIQALDSSPADQLCTFDDLPQLASIVDQLLSKDH
jgi:CheY-like chemotaxis protein